MSSTKNWFQNANHRALFLRHNNIPSLALFLEYFFKIVFSSWVFWTGSFRSSLLCMKLHNCGKRWPHPIDGMSSVVASNAAVVPIGEWSSIILGTNPNCGMSHVFVRNVIAEKQSKRLWIYCWAIKPSEINQRNHQNAALDSEILLCFRTADIHTEVNKRVWHEFSDDDWWNCAPWNARTKLRHIQIKYRLTIASDVLAGPSLQ